MRTRSITSATRSATSFMPGENVHHMFHEDAPALKRAGFVDHHLWVTQYSPRERFAAGDYPNQSRGGDGPAGGREQDRRCGTTTSSSGTRSAPPRGSSRGLARDADVAYIGFHLKPSGFFDGNPALDVAAPEHACQTK